jgi:Ala-tRNA(Pro) deacylase
MHMTIAKRLKSHLDEQGVSYETVAHPRTATASESAQAAHVPGDHLAKTVVVHVETGPVLAVVPSDRRVDLSALQALLDRRLGLASETEIGALFDDCDIGAAPPVGAAYGVPIVVDSSLEGLDRVWFEGGDHRTLVCVAGADFDRLMRDAQHGTFSHA